MKDGFRDASETTILEAIDQINTDGPKFAVSANKVATDQDNCWELRKGCPSCRNSGYPMSAELFCITAKT
jgi:hypothetical protein